MMRLRLLCACSVLALASALPVIRDDAPTDVFGTGLDSAVISEPNMDIVPLSNCKELQTVGALKSGQYMQNLGDNGGEFNVYCDMDEGLFGGGWTVIQRRVPREVETPELFSGKDWKLYKNGFGTFHGSYWMGLEKIHRITTSEDYELYIGMQTGFGEKAWARYSTFSVGDEKSKYTLTVSGYTGTAGDSLLDHSRQGFYTKDEDNDNHCSERRTGGWWFTESESCVDSNLNGRYYQRGLTMNGDGITWEHFGNVATSMTQVVMAIRPRN